MVGGSPPAAGKAASGAVEGLSKPPRTAAAASGCCALGLNTPAITAAATPAASEVFALCVSGSPEAAAVSRSGCDRSLPVSGHGLKTRLVAEESHEELADASGGDPNSNECDPLCDPTASRDAEIFSSGKKILYIPGEVNFEKGFSLAGLVLIHVFSLGNPPCDAP